MRFAAAAAWEAAGKGVRERKSARELLEYAEAMIRRGREEEAKENVALALKYYKLAQRHQESWLEAACAEEPGGRPARRSHEIEEVAAVRRRLEAELAREEPTTVPAHRKVVPAWTSADERQFFDAYCVYYAASGSRRRRQSPAPVQTRRASPQRARGRRPWRAPSRSPAIPSPPASPPARRRKPTGIAEAWSSSGPLKQSELVTDARSQLLDQISSEASKRSSKIVDDVADGSLRELLEQKELQIAMLTRQLEQAGCAAVTEALPLAEAKARLQRALEAMASPSSSAGMSEADAQAEVEKMSLVIDNHPEHIEALRKEHEAWLSANDDACRRARDLQLTFVPPDVLASGTSKAALSAAGLSSDLAARVYSTPALWLLRAPPDFVGRVHDADLRGKFGYQGLDLVELRALWAAAKDVVFENDSKKAKAAWRDALLERLKRHSGDASLPTNKKRHPAYPDDALGPFDPKAPVLPVRLTRETDDASSRTDDSENADTSPKKIPGSSGVVSEAVAQLRRSSSFRDKDAILPASKAQRQAAQRRRETISPPPPGNAFLDELKSSLSRRRGDVDEQTSPADRPPRPPRLAATAPPKPGGPAFAVELQKLAAAREARAAQARTS